MHRSRLLFIGLLWVSTAGALAAEPASRTSSAPLQAELFLGNSESARTVLVRGIQNDMVSLTMEGARAGVRMSVKNIRRIDFYLGETVERVMQEVEEKNYGAAARGLRTPALRLMPFLVIPENNVLPVTESYALALHHLDDQDALREFYRQMADVMGGEKAQSAKAWLAYLDARSGLVDGVQDTFEAFGELERGEEIDLLRHLALCRINLPGEAYGVAVDHAAKAVATCEAEDLLYPEAMYLSAQCYDGLARKALARLTAEREEQVTRELLNERVRVAREMEAEADKEGTAPPTEQQILDRVDREAVEKRVPALPELKEISHSKTAQRAYLFVERVFPDTTWGALATERVLPESREGSDQELVMSKKEPMSPRTTQASGPSKQGAVKGETLDEFLVRTKEWRRERNQPLRPIDIKNITDNFVSIDVNKDGLVTSEERRKYWSKQKQ